MGDADDGADREHVAAGVHGNREVVAQRLEGRADGVRGLGDGGDEGHGLLSFHRFGRLRHLLAQHGDGDSHEGHRDPRVRAPPSTTPRSPIASTASATIGSTSTSVAEVISVTCLSR